MSAPTPMLDLLEIENYGCIHKASIQLSPIHALVGPNDSGKSTILRALHTLCWMAQGTAPSEEGRSLLSFFQRARRSSKPSSLFVALDQQAWRVSASMAATGLRRVAEFWAEGGTSSGSSLPKTLSDPLRKALAGSLLLRLDPDEMRQPSSLIQHDQPLRFMSARGAGLAGLFDAIRERDIESFLRINQRFLELFPGVKGLSLRNVSSSEKAMGISLRDGTHVGPEFMSEGMLYFLAFCALKYIDPVAILLIEEPENGLHPSRIAEVMAVLREISASTQVVMATHSPLVINELQGHEISVVTRDAERGTSVTLLRDTHNYETRSKIYANGELWVSYANGKDEAPLLRDVHEVAS